MCFSIFVNFLKFTKIEKGGEYEIMKKAFTLIELLIVIAIIGILAGILFVSIGQNPLIRARDTKRISDLQNLRTALTLYYTDNNAYPAALANLIPTYIPAVPVDPSNGTSHAAECALYNGGNYGYVYTEASGAYVVQTCLENGNQSLATDCDTATLTPACVDDGDFTSGTAGGVFDIHS